MATLSPAALVKSQGGGSTVDSLRASAVRQPPMSPPSSSSSRMATDSTLIVGGAGGDSTAAPPQRTVRRVIKSGDKDFAAVDDLISKLPDVLFPFEADSGDDELTPFKAVYGPSPGDGGGGGGGGGEGKYSYITGGRLSHRKFGSSGGERLDDADRRCGGDGGGRGDGGFGGNSPNASLRFGSAPDRDGANTFGGRESPVASSPPTDRPHRKSVSGGAGGGGSKYQPPSRRGGGSLSFGSPPHSHNLPPRDSRGKQGGGGGGSSGGGGGGGGAPHNKPGKKNPVTPGFNGAGFRSIREIYVSKVHDFLCTRAIEGAPWVKLSGKDSIANVCEKPLTVPENYTQFFRDHAAMFELSPDARYVAAKVPGEEHACIPPPPSASVSASAPSYDGGTSSGGSGTPSLSSSPAATGALLSDELRLQGGFLSFSMPPSSSSSSSSSKQQQQQQQRVKVGKPGRGLRVSVDASSDAQGRSQSPSSSSSSSGDNGIGGKNGIGGGSGSGNGYGSGNGGGKLCMYLSRPGGCRAGDACRFSHAVAAASGSGKPPRSPSWKNSKKLASGGGGGGGGGGADDALPA